MSFLITDGFEIRRLESSVKQTVKTEPKESGRKREAGRRKAKKRKGRQEKADHMKTAGGKPEEAGPWKKKYGLSR